MSFATDLSNKINELQYNTLPADAVHWAKVGILDTVGVTIAGAAEDATRILLGVSGSSSGPSLVFGHARRIGALDAALVNGTASHALDFDDCNNTLGGHPSVPILPALFALADETGATGKDFIAAYVAGFEAECKLSMVVNFYQYTKGWHPTTTIGVFGSAAACAHLLKLSVEKTATALSIAASLAAGVKSNFGTMTKPLHVGHCARSGLFAALLARDGFTAGDKAFEHKQGYFEVFNGAGNYDASKAIPAWAKPLDITRPGIAIKSYPCCGSTHPAIDCMLELVQKHNLKPEQVARIDSWTHTRRLEHTNRPDPQSYLDAKFSVQYTLARGESLQINQNLELTGSQLLGDRRQQLQFAVPSRLDSYGFHLQRIGAAVYREQAAQIFRLGLDGWLGLVAPDIEVTYSSHGSRLLRFKGWSNIREDDGGATVKADSSRPCCSRTTSAVEQRAPSRA